MNLPPKLQVFEQLFEAAGGKYRLPAEVLAAIAWHESKGDPLAMGSDGHGRGLMQIDSHWHPDFVARVLPDGTPAWQNPAESIEYGAGVLAGYLRALGGDLYLAVDAYNEGPGGVHLRLSRLPLEHTREQVEAAADSGTTHGNYGADVMAHAERFKGTG